MFELCFSTSLVRCQEPLPEFPRPDRVEIIVVRDGCEQTFLVEIDEDDTVVEVDSLNERIELRDPIVVPACEE